MVYLSSSALSLSVCLFLSLWVLRAVCHVTVEMRGVNGGSCRHDTPAQNSLLLQEGTEESFSLSSSPFFSLSLLKCVTLFLPLPTLSIAAAGGFTSFLFHPFLRPPSLTQKRTLTKMTFDIF